MKEKERIFLSIFTERLRHTIKLIQWLYCNQSINQSIKYKTRALLRHTNTHARTTRDNERLDELLHKNVIWLTEKGELLSSSLSLIK